MDPLVARFGAATVIRNCEELAESAVQYDIDGWHRRLDENEARMIPPRARGLIEAHARNAPPTNEQKADFEIEINKIYNEALIYRLRQFKLYDPDNHKPGSVKLLASSREPCHFRFRFSR